MVEVNLIVDGKPFVDSADQPLLHAEGKPVEVICRPQTDMRHIDKCFRGQPSFEHDMREAPAESDCEKHA